jgi:hypothetical protein
MLVVITALFALVVIVLLEAVRAIALCLFRWSVSLVVGVSIIWLAHRNGFADFEAAALGALAIILIRDAPVCAALDHVRRHRPDGAAASH